MSNFLHNKVEEVKKQALKDAEQLEKSANEKAKHKHYKDAASLYDSAAQYYYTAGHNPKANMCWDAADACRETAAELEAEVEQRR